MHSKEYALSAFSYCFLFVWSVSREVKTSPFHGEDGGFKFPTDHHIGCWYSGIMSVSKTEDEGPIPSQPAIFACLTQLVRVPES